MDSSAAFSNPTKLRADLLRGRLDVSVDSSTIAPDSLFGFAERRNPKRAFLFVSRVLGRHIPARPSVMLKSFQDLAHKIPADLPGPVLVIGMAETAVGLGAGVHRAYSATRPDALYMVSTRHPTGSALFARFEEEHSHASAHLIHLPVDPALREMMLGARSLVLVDDEASTGKTFINLHQALVEAGLSKIERVVTCVLTDWSAGAVSTSMGAVAEQVSLLQGSYSFDEDLSAPLPEMPEVGTVAMGDWPLVTANDWGRMGVLSVADTLAPGITVKRANAFWWLAPVNSSGARSCSPSVWRRPEPTCISVPPAVHRLHSVMPSTMRCRSPTTMAWASPTSSTTCGRVSSIGC